MAAQAALIAAGLVGASCSAQSVYGAPPCPPGCYVPPSDAAVEADNPFGDASFRDGGESDAGDAAPEGGADAHVDAGLDAADGGG